MIHDWVPRHRITVDDYHRMAEAGILNEDSRVELIEGVLIDMAPIGISHHSAVDRLNRLLVQSTGENAIIRVQGSFRLSNFTEPQPDLIVLKPREDFYSSRVATGDDTLLVIEVSDTTLKYDRHVKMPLYARYGIPEAWIVDLENGLLHCFRALKEEVYTEVTSTAQPGILTVPGVAETTVDLTQLLAH